LRNASSAARYSGVRLAGIDGNRLCLLQPVRHPHLAVHRRCGGEVLLRLLALARAPVELAEAEVTVGDERAHAPRLGERPRLAVVAFSVLGAAGRRDVTGE